MNEADDQDGVGRALAVLHRVEDAVLALVLGGMVLLAPTRIVLRLFDVSITWADPLLRVMVLWVGLLGAVAATRGDRQISVDVLSHVLPDRPKAALRVLTSVIAAGVSALVAWHSFAFVATEYEWETVAFESVPAWMTQVVIPFSFAVIALRYLVYGFGNAMIAAGLREAPE